MYFDNKVHCKAGSVELSRTDAEKIYTKKQYILTFSRVYSINFSAAQNKFYSRMLYERKNAGFTGRGRFYVLDAEMINKIIGFPLLNVERMEG